MSSTKLRIFFCVYFQQGPTGSQGSPRVFHCGLWVEDKRANGPGEYFHVQFEPVYRNRPNRPSGWVYSSSIGHGANYKRSGQLIGRILLGKLERGVTANHIHDICQRVAMPSNSENCWDWTGRAISTIQHQGFLTRRSWSGRDGLRARAYQKTCYWFEKDGCRLPEKPHYWDIYGTEGKHCVVM